VVGEHPYMAAALAALYQFHTLGDPYENWKKRVIYLAQDTALFARDEDPVRWAKKQNALAIACQEEPDVDFNQALIRRIARHQQALDTRRLLVQPYHLRISVRCNQNLIVKTIISDLDFCK